MAARRWIRLDVSWEDSPWLDALDGTAAGCWPRLLCLVKRDGLRGRCKRPDPGVLARRWRVTRDAVTALEDAAVADGALAVENGDWIVTAWATYQEPDPTAAERQRKHRAEMHRLSPLRRDTVTDRESHRDPSRDIDREKQITDERLAGAGAPPPKKPKKEPSGWSAKACDAWQQRFGGTAPGGKIGSALKPLVKQYGEEEVLYVWGQYLATEDPKYISPAAFAQKYKTWRDGRQKAAPQQFDYSNATTEWQGEFTA